MPVAAFRGIVAMPLFSFHTLPRCLTVMITPAQLDLLYLAAFAFGGLLFALGPFILVYFLSPRWTRTTLDKTGQAIECGMDPIGDAWIRYSAVYYLYALVFVAFAVDVLFLIPVALIYNRVFELRDFLGLTVFLGILSLVIVYAWKKGVFSWQRQ